MMCGKNFENPMTKLKKLPSLKEGIDGELIDRLSKGDIFGEIGLLTNLKRTCTVIT